MGKERRVEDVNLLSSEPLMTPAVAQEKIPLADDVRRNVLAGREQVRAIMDREDRRLFLIVGPCSIHNTEMALDYAARLHALAEEVKDTLLLVMRVYFEKPRTSIGWKGFITDPALDDSFRIEEGICEARKLLVRLGEMALPAATEFVDPIIPQYIADLITWTAIGARTTESQKHREMASGLSTPVGLKNSTYGTLDTAVNGLVSVAGSHRFLGISKTGEPTIFETAGNRYAHIVLRGGRTPNYDTVSVRLCEKALRKAGVRENVVIDCSHGNSAKDHTLQPLIFRDCLHQVREGNNSIIGLMIESFLEPGRQSIPEDLDRLAYGVSVTDGCIGWNETEELIRDAREYVREALLHR